MKSLSRVLIIMGTISIVASIYVPSPKGFALVFMGGIFMALFGMLVHEVFCVNNFFTDRVLHQQYKFRLRSLRWAALSCIAGILLIAVMSCGSKSGKRFKEKQQQLKENSLLPMTYKARLKRVGRGIFKIQYIDNMYLKGDTLILREEEYLIAYVVQ